MSVALVLNPGSNSLKFELIEVAENQQVASQARKIASAALDDISKDAKLSVYNGREVVSKEPVEVTDVQSSVRIALNWLRSQPDSARALHEISLVGVRVVHGGSIYCGPVRFSKEVRATIESLEDLAPLHNKNSLEILDVVAEKLHGVPAYATFDTAFHRSLRETAWRYPIHRETADRHGVRKFGFHGISHRYMLEQYANSVGRPKDEISLVTLHLESGASACAIARGKSVDTTMGMTPLEGLMMGSRSGSVDPAIVPYLMRKEGKSAEEIITLLNKQSGLIGIAGGSVDTRVLAERRDDKARLALAMFSYRVRLAVGAYLAALGDAEAVLFGGGIGEDSPWLREAVCDGLGGWGLQLDRDVNMRSVAGQMRISTDKSRLHAWAMPVEEGLQIAHECMRARAGIV